jgi:intein/homing endonuclease
LFYPEPAFVDYDKEKDSTFTFSETIGALDYNKSCILMRLLGYLLADGGITKNNCYKNYSSGQVKYAYDSAYIHLGTKIDATNLQKDITSLIGKTPAIQKCKFTYKIVLPMELCKWVLSIDKIEGGKRINSDITMPAFIMSKDCPKWVIREFLKGLMGGDGHCPTLSGDKFGKVAFSQSKVYDCIDSLINYMKNLQILFEKFNIKTFISNVVKNKMGEGYTVKLNVTQDCLITFYDTIGYAYCVGKTYKLAVVASYYKLKRETKRQYDWVCCRTKELRNIMTICEALKKACAELKMNEPIFNQHYSLPELQSLNLNLSNNIEASSCKFKKCYFPSAETYLKMTGSYEKFVTSDSKKSHSDNQDNLCSPCYYLSILDKKEIGYKKVYDIEVKDTHNFVANGAVVHNCAQDCVLPQELVDKMHIFYNQIAMANVCSVPLDYLLYRGQQIKVVSQIYQLTMKKNYIIPDKSSSFVKGSNLTKTDEDEKESFQGATVLPPKPGLYDNPVITLDFASLYPSIIRAHNLCYSSFVFDEKYLNLENVEYTVTNDGKYYYAKDAETVLPELLSNLKTWRDDAKIKMKNAKTPLEKIVFNNLQLAYKVSMNSVYGFIGAHTLNAKQIAETVTFIGRTMIEKTKNYVEENHTICEVIYGDSVAKGTPILVKHRDTLETFYVPIDELFDEKFSVEYSNFKPLNKELKEKQYSLRNDFLVMSSNGFVDIKKVIRHKTNKKIYCVFTQKGCVLVTEDHSLLNKNLKQIKPNEINKDTKLYHY